MNVEKQKKSFLLIIFYAWYKIDKENKGWRYGYGDGYAKRKSRQDEAEACSWRVLLVSVCGMEGGVEGMI